MGVVVQHCPSAPSPRSPPSPCLFSVLRGRSATVMLLKCRCALSPHTSCRSRLMCFISEGFPKFLHIFHLSETRISIQHSRISCGFVHLLGGLWFHKTMKRLCLSRLTPSVTDVILIIYFLNLSHSAIIQCKLTKVRNTLYFGISEHFRQEKPSE